MLGGGWGSALPLNSPAQSLSNQLALSGSDKTALLSASASKHLPDELSSSSPSKRGRQFPSQGEDAAAIHPPSPAAQASAEDGHPLSPPSLNGAAQLGSQRGMRLCLNAVLVWGSELLIIIINLRLVQVSLYTSSRLSYLSGWFVYCAHLWAAVAAQTGHELAVTGY